MLQVNDQCHLLLRKLNQTQPMNIYLDVLVSIRGLRQKKMKLILLFLLTKASERDRNVKVNVRWLCLI